MIKCPEDREALVVATSEGHTGYLCASCAGTWLPANYIASIAHERRFEPEAFLSSLLNRTSGESAFACPNDGNLLARAHVHDIELDWCRQCQGVWFNAGELGRLLAHHNPKDSTPSVGTILAADVGTNILFALLFS